MKLPPVQTRSSNMTSLNFDVEARRKSLEARRKEEARQKAAELQEHQRRMKERLQQTSEGGISRNHLWLPYYS